MQPLHKIYGLITYLICTIYFYNNFFLNFTTYIYPKNIGKKIAYFKFYNLFIYLFQ